MTPDDPEGETVEDDEEEEGDEGHHHEVGDEQVVPAVAVVLPEGGHAHLRKTVINFLFEKKEKEKEL